MSENHPGKLRDPNVAGGFSYEEPLIFEHSRPGRIGFSLPDLDVPSADPGDTIPAQDLRSEAAQLPEVSEVEVIRRLDAAGIWLWVREGTSP